MMLWLAIRFPRLMLDALTPTPAPQDTVAVREQQRLVAVSQAAREAGVRPGMKPGTALALCDTLQICDRAPEQEQQWLVRQARALTHFTPTICPQQDALLLELGSSLRLFHGPARLLDQLRSRLPANIPWQLAWGHTPHAAHLLSRQPLASSESCLVMDAEGLPEVAASRERFLALLAQQPVTALPFPERTLQAIAGTGLVRLGQLFDLPAAALQRRFGIGFLHWLQQLRGDRPDLRTPLAITPRFQGALAFDAPVNQSAGLQGPMQILLNDLQHWLQQHQWQVRVIRWQFFPLRGEPESLLVRRALAAHHSDSWMALTWRHLERQQLRAPVLKLTLDTGRPLPLAAPPAHLFAALERPAPNTLLDKLANLPGLQLYRPHLLDQHLPEHSEVAQAPAHDASESSPAPRSPFHDPPLWWLEPAQPLRCRHQVPHWRGAALELLPGHQQLNEPWWQSGRARHYHLARHPSGIYCWLFCTPNPQGQWFLQGFF